MSYDTEMQDGSEPSTDAEELPRMYRGYDDDHDAETLSDFGLDLSVDTDEGILVPPDVIAHIPLQTERIDEFPIEYLIIRPVGVGPSQAGAFADTDGTESVFVNIHPVRAYDIPGHYVRAEPHTTTAHLERSTVEQCAREYTIVAPMGDYNPFHWQDPENDPHRVLHEDPEN